MRLERYPLRMDPSYKIFEFTSEGPKGNILKEVIFEQMGNSFVFNLAFGDKCPKTGKIDDLAVTNNGDTEKVLATVVEAVIQFLENYPDNHVHACGSTASRNRMYQMGISKYLLDKQADYVISGLKPDGQLEYYHKNKNYRAFVIRLKNHNFSI